MSAQKNVAPVIIKRKKIVVAGRHRGGAWKVAYADFVTAMMAFFLMMWLLSTTTESQRKGLADYFSPTVPISERSSGGDGHFGGESIVADDTLANDGVGASNRRATESRLSRGATGVDLEADRELAELQRQLDSELSGTNGESMISLELKRHIITRVTDEGLVVELFDIADAPLFEARTAEPTQVLKQLAALLAEMGETVRNSVAVEGHISAVPIVLRHNPVWDISTQRAHEMRGLLRQKGLSSPRFARVTGHADRDSAVSNPMAVRNNRLKVIFLRSGS